MAFRGGELKNSTATYPLDGDLRGGSQFKDWYYFSWNNTYYWTEQ